MLSLSPQTHHRVFSPAPRPMAYPHAGLAVSVPWYDCAYIPTAHLLPACSLSSPSLTDGYTSLSDRQATRMPGAGYHRASRHSASRWTVPCDRSTRSVRCPPRYHHRWLTWYAGYACQRGSCWNESGSPWYNASLCQVLPLYRHRRYLRYGYSRVPHIRGWNSSCRATGVTYLCR